MHMHSSLANFQWYVSIILYLRHYKSSAFLRWGYHWESNWRALPLQRGIITSCFVVLKTVCGNPGLGFIAVVIDLLFDFKTCPNYQNCCRLLLIYRDGLKCLYKVVRSLFLLFLTCSARPCLGPASQDLHIFLPISAQQIRNQLRS